jgi:hypothetical protein
MLQVDVSVCKYDETDDGEELLEMRFVIVLSMF